MLVTHVLFAHRKPGVTGRGLYELRPECAKQFNLYFHHYSRADQSKAEEAQRKLKRQNGEDMGKESQRETLAFYIHEAHPLNGIDYVIIVVIGCGLSAVYQVIRLL